jgi:hypothetical protein
MLIHQKLFQSFLLYYKRQTLWDEEGPSEAEVMSWTPEEFKTYLTTKNFMMIILNIVVHGLPFLLDHLMVVEITADESPPSTPSVANVTGVLRAQEFHRSVKRDIAHYQDLNDDKGFRIWNRGFKTDEEKLLSKKCRSLCMP